MRTGKRFNIGRKRRVVSKMVRWMLANDIQNRYASAVRIVKIGNAIGETWSQVKKGSSRFACHSCIAVSCCGHYAFEETQHTTDAWGAFQGLDDVHFGGSRICETSLHTSSGEALNKALGTIHFGDFLSSLGEIEWIKFLFSYRRRSL